MYQSYADDTQIYTTCDNTATAIELAIQRLQDCIADVCSWMSKNTLKLNQDKTEFIIFSKKDHHGRDYALKVGNCRIQAVQHIKVLGVLFYEHNPTNYSHKSISKHAYQKDK